MAYFRKKPVIIEAVQFENVDVLETGEESIHFKTSADLPEWLRAAIVHDKIFPDPVQKGSLVVKTLEGPHLASPGDWIICGVKGELYPCKPEIFAMTYDPVDEQDIEVTGVAI